jgi:hypothetical protein
MERKNCRTTKVWFFTTWMLVVLLAIGNCSVGQTITDVTLSIPSPVIKSPLSGYQLGLVLKTASNQSFVVGASVIESDRNPRDQSFDRYKQVEKGVLGDTFSLFNQDVAKRGVGVYVGYKKEFSIKKLKFETEYRLTAYRYTREENRYEASYEIIENPNTTQFEKTDRLLGSTSVSSDKETFQLPAISAGIAPVFEAMEGRLVFTTQVLLGYVPNKGMRVYSNELEEYRPLSEGLHTFGNIGTNGFPIEMSFAFGLRYRLKGDE